MALIKLFHVTELIISLFVKMFANNKQSLHNRSEVKKNILLDAFKFILVLFLAMLPSSSDTVSFDQHCCSPSAAMAFISYLSYTCTSTQTQTWLSAD